jgi:hypothetical protein
MNSNIISIIEKWKDKHNLGGSRASQIMSAILAKKKAKKLGKVEFDDKRPRKVSKYIVKNVMDKDNKKKFMDSIDKENIRYILSLYPNLLNSDWKKIYKELLELLEEYKKEREKRPKQHKKKWGHNKENTQSVVFEKVNLDAVKEVEKAVKEEMKQPAIKEDIKKLEKKPIKPKEIEKIAENVAEKAVKKAVGNNLKNLTEEERRAYWKEANKRRQEKKKREREAQGIVVKRGRKKKQPAPVAEEKEEEEPDTEYETSDDEKDVFLKPKPKKGKGKKNDY